MFKKGDIVRCINPGGSIKFKYIKGNLYTVEKVDDIGDKKLWLVTLKEAGFDERVHCYRFELVEERVIEIQQKIISKGWGFE